MYRFVRPYFALSVVLFFSSSILHGQKSAYYITHCAACDPEKPLHLIHSDTGCSYIFPFVSTNRVRYHKFTCDLNQSSGSLTMLTGFQVIGYPDFEIPAVNVGGTSYYINNKSRYAFNYTIEKVDTSGLLAEIPLYWQGYRGVPIGVFVNSDTVYYIVKDSAFPNKSVVYFLNSDSLEKRWEWDSLEILAVDPVQGSSDVFYVLHKLSGLKDSKLGVSRIDGEKITFRDSIESKGNIKGFHNEFGNYFVYPNSANGSFVKLKIDSNGLMEKEEYKIPQGFSDNLQFWLIPIDNRDFVVSMGLLGIPQAYESYLMHFTPWGELMETGLHSGSAKERSSSLIYIPFLYIATRLENGKYLSISEDLAWIKIVVHANFYIDETITYLRYGHLANYFNQFPALGDKNIDGNRGLKILGNPISGLLRIQCEQSSAVSLHNNLGQIVHHDTIYSGESELDLSFLPGGVYYLKTSFGQSVKIVVAH